MQISKDHAVSLSYQLTVEGDIVDTATAQKPLQFIFGSGMLLPKFEENIAGKKVGDCFKFTLSAIDGYGVVNDQNIIDFPLSTFMEDGKLEEDLLKVGNLIPMRDNSGRVLQGTVVELKDESVTLDFNHPLAGMDLNFEGKIEEVRPATEKELNKGHVCGCGENACGSNSCDEDETHHCGCGGH
ncbi:MAG: FKBP-type peptidyl-prolyl cis-trans isomerase [Bacteroidales bacterium]